MGYGFCLGCSIPSPWGSVSDKLIHFDWYWKGHTPFPRLPSCVKQLGLNISPHKVEIGLQSLFYNEIFGGFPSINNDW